MTEKESKFIEDQFKGIGALKALTPELVEQMKTGVQNIEHKHSQKYEGDGIADATFFLKKGDGHNYFLNKWEMEAIKEGETSGVKQTFYNNHFPRNKESENYDAAKYYTSFTFKSSYNYLMGDRPVHNTYRNDNKQEYQQWDVLKIKRDEEGKIKRDEEGKAITEKKQYHENYPYDHEKVMGNYNILDLTNEEYRKRLIQSHERGNVQLATFVNKDGKHDKLYTNPNITVGAMNVYDAEKKPISIDRQIEMGYVQKEFGEKLKERLQELKQKNDSETRQQQAPVQENKREGLAKEDKEGESVGKENKQTQTNKASQKEEGFKQKNRHKNTLS